MKIWIYSIIKDKQSYLDEWIQYNLAMGYTDIHLYGDYVPIKQEKKMCLINFQ